MGKSIFIVRCEADNGYARDSASVSVSVENIVVREECRDNPHFANCKLIVKARSVSYECWRETDKLLSY